MTLDAGHGITSGASRSWIRLLSQGPLLTATERGVAQAR